MRNLTCKLGNYNGKKYLRYKYTDSYEKTCDEFTNMECFTIDVKCEKFNEIMLSVGGTVADLTKRLFEKEHLDVYYMVLAAIPQSTNNFVFAIIYLNKNREALKYYYVDNNYALYRNFKKRFESCTISKGSVYDLDFDFLKEQISDEVTADFDLIVEGRPVTTKDVIVINNDDICLGNYEQKSINQRGLEIDHFEFKLAFGGLSFIRLDGVAVTTSGETVKTYEIKREYLKEGVITADDYINYERKKLKEYFGYDIDCEIKIEDYTFMLSLDFAKKYSDKLSYKIVCERKNMKLSENLIGKVIDAEIHDCFSGSAEVKDVTSESITLQWISLSPCYENTIYGKDLYLQPSSYSLDEIASIQNERSLSLTEIKEIREESMKQDVPVFKRFEESLNEEIER